MRNSIILLAAAAIALVAANPAPTTRYKAPKCTNGKSRCGSSCFDLSSDAAHCGSCNNSCGTGTTCKRGKCQCPPGLGMCHRGGGCVSLTTKDNCGRCGNRCGKGYVCGGSSCVKFKDSQSINFENYADGTPNGQHGWTSKGSAGIDQFHYDHLITSHANNVPAGFGMKSLRISDDVTSGEFDGQTYSEPLTDSVGESDSTAAGFPVNKRFTHFVLDFDVAAVYQPDPADIDPAIFGTTISMSPDRGDGSRMSYLKFTDNSDGIGIEFIDYQQFLVNFEATDFPLLDRTKPHHIKMTIQIKEGPGNDVVCVYIDGELFHTGTTWEDFYRYDPEQHAEQSTRLIKCVGWFSRGNDGETNPAHKGYGFYFDNLVYGAY